jgi:hypothetical protein
MSLHKKEAKNRFLFYNELITLSLHITCTLPPGNPDSLQLNTDIELLNDQFLRYNSIISGEA